RPAGSTNLYTVLLPRAPVTATPYSLQSLTATTALSATTAKSATTATSATNSAQLGGVAASQYVLTSDSRLSDARPPTSGSSGYIQNTVARQSSSNFNISGNGTAGGSLSANIVTAATQYNLGGNRILSGQGDNLFVGTLSGVSNTTGDFNVFIG